MAYPDKITNFFGKDLIKLLGPKSDRVQWNSLSFDQKQKRIAEIPEYVNTSKLGKFPSFTDMLFECFRVLVNKGSNNPLKGIDLPEFDSLTSASSFYNTPALNYFGSLTEVSRLYKNADKQRDIFLRHILVDIVFQFEPGLVFPGVGREDSAGKIYVNDAQHRILGCMFLGISQVPLNYISSDDEYWDVQQYAAININSLQCSNFDRYRIRVQRGNASKVAGYPIDPEDQLCMDLSDVLNNNGITAVEKGDKIGKNGKVLSDIGNLIKYWKTYGKEIATRAIELNATMFPTSAFHTANSWGLMEFLKVQDPTIDPVLIDCTVHQAIKSWLPNDNQGNKLHSCIKTTCKEDNDITSIRFEPVVIAEGIKQICEHFASDSEWEWKEPHWPEEKYEFEMQLV